jgi:hypothetical protein
MVDIEDHYSYASSGNRQILTRKLCNIIYQVVDDYRRLPDTKDIYAGYLSAEKGMRVELDKI